MVTNVEIDRLRYLVGAEFPSLSVPDKQVHTRLKMGHKVR